MKFLLDSSILLKLEETIGSKAPEALAAAIRHEWENAGDIIELTYEDVIRAQKISQRKEVAKNELARDVLRMFNTITGKGAKPIEANLKLIRSILSVYTKEEIETVVINKTEQWKGDFKMDKYLHPQTIFRMGNFDKYAGEQKSPEAAEKGFASHLDSLLGDQ